MSLWSLRSVLQVILIGRTVEYFTPGSNLTEQDAYISSVGVILCSALKSLIFTAYDIDTSQMGMQIRVSICSAIYRKVDRCYVLFLLFAASLCAFVVHSFIFEAFGFHRFSCHSINTLYCTKIKREGWWCLRVELISFSTRFAIWLLGWRLHWHHNLLHVFERKLPSHASCTFLFAWSGYAVWHFDTCYSVCRLCFGTAAHSSVDRTDGESRMPTSYVICIPTEVLEKTYLKSLFFTQIFNFQNWNYEYLN